MYCMLLCIVIIKFLRDCMYFYTLFQREECFNAKNSPLATALDRDDEENSQAASDSV